MCKSNGKEDTLLEIMSELSYYMSKDGLCATIYYGEAKKSVQVSSIEYSDYVSTKNYELCGEIPKCDAIKERLRLIRYMHKEKNVEDGVFENRYAEDGGEILINMANDELQYIAVTPNGYEVITPEDDVPLFVSDALEKAMIQPVGEDIKAINLLDDLLNLNEEDKFFLKVWLVAAMNPNIKTPILYFLGAAGSGKTSIQNLIRDLINPTERGAVNWDGSTNKELAITLNRSYLVNYDNVSKIDQVKSDMLCQATTGGKKNFRKLYTDNDEINYDLRARVTISSVRNCIKASDLAERIYFMNVPRINAKERIPEDKYSAYYKTNIPKIWGGLLTALSLALDEYEKWCRRHTATYRLASFELFGGLVADILGGKKGYECFQRVMKRNRVQQVFLNDAKRPFFECLMEMLDADEKPFNGKMKKLYERVSMWITDCSELPYSEEIILDYDVFSKAIHYYADGICSLGYDVEFYMSSSDNYSSVRISRNVESE